MPYFSVAIFFAYCFGERLVASIAYKWGGNCIGDLRGEENVAGTRCGYIENFGEEDYEVREPSLNAEVVKNMAHTIADLLFKRSPFLLVN